jgi:hypothetical protein
MSLNAPGRRVTKIAVFIISSAPITENLRFLGHLMVVYIAYISCPSHMAAQIRAFSGGCFLLP